MATISEQYDPNWSAFQKTYQTEHPLVETDAEKADQAKFDKFFQGLYDPSSPNYHKFVDNAQTAFPGVQQWIQDQMKFNKDMAAAFQQQYGHSPILSTTITGPPMKDPITGKLSAGVETIPYKAPNPTTISAPPTTTTAPPTTTSPSMYYGQPVNGPSRATLPQSWYSNPLASMFSQGNYPTPNYQQNSFDAWNYLNRLNSIF